MKLLIILSISFSLCGAAVVNLNWWDRTSIYDIFVWSFQDSNDDGIGDIKGLTSRLDYLKDLGVPAIKLSQIFSSPENIASSYAVDNFYAIHSTLGTLDDFDTLIAKANDKGIKVILDINLNHCHESHEWFQKSIKGIAPYKNYFIWASGQIIRYRGISRPPNSWRNTGGKSSWKWNDERRQFFYNRHNYFSPDFNLENGNVVDEIFKILTFWADKGVAGFNLLETDNYFEVAYDEDYHTVAPDYDNLVRFVGKLRKSLDDYYKSKYSHADTKILMASLPKTDRRTTSKYIGSNQLPTFHFVTVDKMAEFTIQNTAITSFFNRDVKYFTNLVSGERQIEWLLEGADYDRKANNNNKQVAEVLLTIQALLPGVMRIYYGSELGMSEYSTQSKKCIDKKWQCTNTKALPMQWNGLAHAGFSTNDCPLQQPNPNYVSFNVEKEISDTYSTYNLVKNLLELRKNDILKSGTTEFFRISSSVFYLKRSYSEENIYCIVNFNNVPENVDLVRKISSGTMKVLLTAPYGSYEKGDQMQLSSTFVMRPISSIIFTILDE